MTVSLAKPFSATAAGHRFGVRLQAIFDLGGTATGFMAALDAIGSTDKVGAFEQLLADAVNPVDRELYEIGLDIVRGGAA